MDVAGGYTSTASGPTRTCCRSRTTVAAREGHARSGAGAAVQAGGVSERAGGAQRARRRTSASGEGA